MRKELTKRKRTLKQRWAMFVYDVKDIIGAILTAVTYIIALGGAYGCLVAVAILPIILVIWLILKILQGFGVI